MLVMESTKRRGLKHKVVGVVAAYAAKARLLALSRRVRCKCAMAIVAADVCDVASRHAEAQFAPCPVVVVPAEMLAGKTAVGSP